jgi:uncharacterized protein DUF4202
MLQRVFLPAPGSERLALEFPTVSFETGAAAPPAPVITMGQFPAAEAIDAHLAGDAPRSLSLAGGDPERLEQQALATLTRFQRFVGRRNKSSEGAAFDELLARHRALHDLSKPLVRAEFDHALDTWQWLLRLEPNAGFAVQAAALLHDARVAASLLRDLDFAPAAIAHVVRLVEGHEKAPDDREVSTLNDADALSFFSLDSAGFLDHSGPAHTRRKITDSHGRMSERARARLREVVLRPDVEALVQETLSTR